MLDPLYPPHITLVPEAFFRSVLANLHSSDAHYTFGVWGLPYQDQVKIAKIIRTRSGDKCWGAFN